MPVDPAFAALREALEQRHRDASAAAFAAGDEELLRTGLPELDRILGGGFPRGTIAALEGAPSSGRSAVAARLLAVATRQGLGALIGTDLFLPGLAAAGVRLERLMCVPVTDPLGAARAADIVLRSGAFGVVVIPALPSGRGTSAATWTRLASLAHRAGALLVALGVEASTNCAISPRCGWKRRSSACAGTASPGICANSPATTCARPCASTNARHPAPVR